MLLWALGLGRLRFTNTSFASTTRVGTYWGLPHILCTDLYSPRAPGSGAAGPQRGEKQGGRGEGGGGGVL